MRITLESDYALRIVSALASKNDIVDAKTLSDEVSVTLRFTLKILHKLQEKHNRMTTANFIKIRLDSFFPILEWNSNTN